MVWECSPIIHCIGGDRNIGYDVDKSKVVDRQKYTIIICLACWNEYREQITSIGHRVLRSRLLIS